MSKPLKRISFSQFPDYITRRLLAAKNCRIESIEINNIVGSETSLISAGHIETIKICNPESLYPQSGHLVPVTYELNGSGFRNERITLQHSEASMKFLQGSLERMSRFKTNMLRL